MLLKCFSASPIDFASAATSLLFAHTSPAPEQHFPHSVHVNFLPSTSGARAFRGGGGGGGGRELAPSEEVGNAVARIDGRVRRGDNLVFNWRQLEDCPTR